MKTLSAVVTILVILGLGYFLVGRPTEKDAALDASTTTQPNPTTTTMTTPNGLGIEALEQGTGPEAKAGDTVDVHYTGTFTDGEKFDSSVDRGRPFTFTLGAGQVIRGWDLGVAGMKVGERRKLTVPPELGYGEQGAGDVIPPYTTLLFEVELLGIR